MKILITGGTGFIGSKLVPQLLAQGHEVGILTRSKKHTSDHPALTYLQWNGKSMPTGIGLYEAVINLAGASIAGAKWTDEQKEKILQSRVKATRACVEYINRSPSPPKVFLSASAVGYYGVEHKEEIDESAGPGKDFAAEVCRVWEEEANKANCRTIITRIGIVLGKDGGALEKMLPVYKMYLGGRFASGKQGFPWVHIDDIVKSMSFLLNHESASGPFNLTGPELISQGKFSNKLAEALGTKDLFVVPAFMLKLMFGEQAVLFIGGQYPKPQQLESLGYEFDYPQASEALSAVV
ncbi:MAG: TIGR01777 family oxidoreductase [Bacteroidota bacterium]